MLRYFHRVWPRRQNEHHGRGTEEKHHFSCTKYTGWICWCKHTRVINEIESSRGQKQVAFQIFLVGRKFSSPALSCPLLPSSNDQPPPLSLSIHVTKFTGKAAVKRSNLGFTLWGGVFCTTLQILAKTLHLKKTAPPTPLAASSFALLRHESSFSSPELGLSKLFSTLMITDSSTDKEKGDFK